MAINQEPAWHSMKYHLAGQTPPSPKPVKNNRSERYFNRSLSWLLFNDRVLNEAADTTVPVMERLKFLGIVSSNLDEFFMVRVSQIARMAKRQPAFRYPDGLTTSQLLAQIRNHVLKQKEWQAKIFRDLLAVLRKEGVHILVDFSRSSDLDAEITKILPDIKFTLRSNAEPFPPLASERIHVFVRFESEYAIVRIPDNEGRMLRLPSSDGQVRVALLERWLCSKASSLFGGRTVIEAFPFKILRDADLRYHPDDEDSIEDQIVTAVEKRIKAKVVRLEVDAPAYTEGAFFVATALGVESAALYRFDVPLDLRTVSRLASHPAARRLCYPSIQPSLPDKWIKTGDIFQLIRDHDIVLHHPYDSFDFVVNFLETSARDPKVTSIYHTMYRTTRESPIMEALKEAVRSKKKVTAYIEIKARFDELNNVRWAQELRKAGVRVVRPLGGFKVHCKLTQVMRREEGEDVPYLHLGTGNYHPTTARQYTDLGVLTCDTDLGKEVEAFFLALATGRKPSRFEHLLVTPGNMQAQIVKLIRNETEIAKAGGEGRIIAKMNALVDPDTIEELYAASSAGVQIDLLIRGICCLRPGVKGMSENIRVTSIIDRFLEHSRIYYFRANGEEKIYLSSADWMPRNFYSRYEIAFPIKDTAFKSFIRDVVLATGLKDNLRAWLLRPDGRYEKIQAKPDEELVRSQLVFETLARRDYRGTALEHRGRRQ